MFGHLRFNRGALGGVLFVAAASLEVRSGHAVRRGWSGDEICGSVLRAGVAAILVLLLGGAGRVSPI